MVLFLSQFLQRSSIEEKQGGCLRLTILMRIYRVDLMQLEFLKKKQGDLTLQEERTLQDILYELRMNYTRLIEGSSSD
jgi:hypothetical protein